MLPESVPATHSYPHDLITCSRVQACEANPRCRREPLVALLVHPVQHIGRYALLFKGNYFQSFSTPFSSTSIANGQTSARPRARATPTPATRRNSTRSWASSWSACVNACWLTVRKVNTGTLYHAKLEEILRIADAIEGVNPVLRDINC